MATWRRLALEAFPELRRELTRPHEIESVYDLWRELLWMTRDAHTRNDSELLRRIYDYAHWAMRHPSKDLWNPVAVAFLEHLLDGASEERIRAILPWLANDLVADVWGLWELMGVELERVARVLREQKRPVPTA
jgi:hypothetical protein